MVAIGDDELEAIAAFVGKPTSELRGSLGLTYNDGDLQLTLRGNVCPFLENDRCRIQPVKPRQCRTYPFWPEIAFDDRDWQAEREYCPGIGIGPDWSAQQIADMISLLEQGES